MSWFRVEVRKAKDLIIGIGMDGEKIEGEEHVRYYNETRRVTRNLPRHPVVQKLASRRIFNKFRI